MKWVVWIMLAGFLLPGVSPLFGQKVDLMALKKKEDERRKSLAQSKLKVNDTNVNTVSAGGKKYGFVQMEIDGGEVEGEAPVAAGAKKDATKEPGFWKKQQDDLEQRLATLRADIEREQSDLNQLWSDYYNKNIASEQEAIRVQIAQLTNQIEQKKLFVSQAEAQIEELLEKARKAGVPPGWLR
jgi:chromosome segregation ATPase